MTRKTIIKSESEPKLELEPEIPLPEVISETDDYIIINKPAGLLVHPVNERQSEAGQFSLVNWLMEKYPEIGNVGEDPIRPGIVHRLDKEVSGLMVIARNNKSFISLKEQFQDRSMVKEYLGLVYGKVSLEDGEINLPIKRSNSGFKMAAVPLNFVSKNDETVRQASTLFTVARRFHNFTLLALTIKTGRTHQIRVHLQAYGHPLVGDNLYSSADTRRKNHKLGLARIFLVSCKLEFTDLRGERQKFSVGLPEELTELLKKVK
jgi:23S rRNA pseudouridine1911/1915/1917 synthase